MRPFKRGSFVLAIEAGARWCPISLDGVKRVVPRGIFDVAPGHGADDDPPADRDEAEGASGAAALAEEVRRIVASGCQED